MPASAAGQAGSGAGGRLRGHALEQYPATDELLVVGAHPELARRHLAHRGEGTRDIFAREVLAPDAPARIPDPAVESRLGERAEPLPAVPDRLQERRPPAPARRAAR